MSMPSYLNMEVLFLKSADENIEKMTENNYIGGEGLEHMLDDIIESNLQYGFMIITSLNCYIENALSDILAISLGDKNASGNILTKINKLEKHFGIKVQYNNSNIDNMRKIRNYLVHFKTAFVGEATGTLDFEIKGKFAGKYFTKSNMQSLRSESYYFVKKVAQLCNLDIWDYADVIGCTGMEIPITYIYDSSISYEDIDIVKSIDN